MDEIKNRDSTSEQSRSSYCSKCGTPLRVSSKFCPHCGKPIHRDKINRENSAAIIEKNKSSNSPNLNTTKGRTAFIILSIVSISLLVAIVIVSIFFHPRKFDSELRAREKNESEQVSLCRESAISGNPDDQYAMSCYYAGGTGVKQDSYKAFKWCYLAAENGNKKAQIQLASYYQNGQGVAINLHESFKWYLAAAKQGDKEAQIAVAYNYRNGIGTEKNDSCATIWVRKAAENGDVESQYQLGRCYAFGIGVEQNDDEAFKWFQRAATNNHTEAMIMVRRLQKYNDRIKREGPSWVHGHWGIDYEVLYSFSDGRFYVGNDIEGWNEENYSFQCIGNTIKTANGMTFRLDPKEHVIYTSSGLKLYNIY